jgi:hypothetical protein
MSIRPLSRTFLAIAALVGGCLFPLRSARADTSDSPPKAEDPELEASRVRFRKGMDAYATGDFAAAIVTWQAIYSELGRERGYRLAFNLGRAYDAYGDASRAAELYSAYLEEVATRRGRGESLPSIVEKQATDANERLVELVRTRGRLRVPQGKTPVEVRIDGGAPRLAGFSVLLAPGKHVVVFGTGESELRRELVLAEGQEQTIEPPPPKPEPKAPQTRALAPLVETRTTRPFSPVWIFVGAGATALSVVIPALQYSRAVSIASEHDASGDALERERLATEYSGAKTGAYATLAIPMVLGAATLGLGAAFVFGSRTESVRIAGRGLGFDATVTF